MSGSCRSLFLLRRCVPPRYVTLSADNLAQIKTRARVLTLDPEICGYIQQHQYHKWTSNVTSSLRSPSKYESYKTITLNLCTKTVPPVVDDYLPLPVYNSDSEIERKEVFVVQAKGLPWSCTAEDILKFFSESRICGGVKGIHLTVNMQGRPNGQAFIEMEQEEDVARALEKHRQYLGSRYIEVYEVTNDDAESILKKSVELPANDGVVRMRGLPFRCTEEDIACFFSGLEIVENGITIVLDHRGRNSGEAYVQFASQDMASEALQRDREMIGSRYIEVFASRSSEIRSNWQRRETASLSAPRKQDSAPQPNSSIESQHVSGQPLHYVHMRGLPFQATGRDIAQFFSPLALSKILIEYGPDGRPSGEGCVYFTCHQDAVSAMTRDKNHMGERFIELYLNSGSDIMGE